MKIAVVCPYDVGRAGGVQQLSIELVERLAGGGHRAWLVAPGDPGAVAGRCEVRSVGSSVPVKANDSVAPVSLSPAVFARVRDATQDADVLHVHEPLMPLVSLAAMRLRLPRVVTFHADAPRWAAVLYRTGGRMVDRGMRRSVVTAVSAVASAGIPRRWGQVEVIPNGLDVAAYARPEARRVASRVTFLGRDDPRKGLDVLLAAWVGVQAAVPAAELVVIGAERDEAPPGVRFVGRVDEDAKRTLLTSSSIHVAPNTGGESFGIVVAEAMAAGAAVIASDLAAFRDVLGECGTFVPAGAAGPLREALVALLGDATEVRRHAQCASARVADFDWGVVLGRWIAAYGRAIGM